MANPVDQLGEQLDALAAIIADVLTSAVSAAAAATQEAAGRPVGLRQGSVTNLATGPLAAVVGGDADRDRQQGRLRADDAGGRASVGLRGERRGRGGQGRPTRHRRGRRGAGPIVHGRVHQ